MNVSNVEIISWNVRGLNAAERCLAVHNLATTLCPIACLQETKLQNIDSSLATFIGAYKLDNFIFKPAADTKGGILLLWKGVEVAVTNVHVRRYSIMAEVTLHHCSTSFIISVVYGPSEGLKRSLFSSTCDN
jgi:exonuclease III